MTIQYIADAAGVSRGTVDRALNHRGRTNIEVEKRILQIACETGYEPKHRGKRKKLCIGIVTHLCNEPFMVPVNKGILDAKAELEDKGMGVIIEENSSADIMAQLESLDRLEKRGIDALAIMPVDSEEVRSRLIHLTKESSIPIITFNSDITGIKRQCFIGLNNWKSGQVAAGLMGMLMGGSGKVLVITGSFSNDASNQRLDGFIDETKKSFPCLEVVGVHSSFDCSDEVEKIIVRALNNFQNLGGIFVVSSGQEGIARAFDKVKPSKHPFVITYDRTPVNEQNLLKGNVDFLIDQEGYFQGYKAVHMLHDILIKGIQPTGEYIYTSINIKTKYNL